MSDPVSHAEIEDVLSSIRRLVSEDSSNKPAAPEPAARLVLTPALRVQDREETSPAQLDAPQSDAARPVDTPPQQAQPTDAQPTDTQSPQDQLSDVQPSDAPTVIPDSAAVAETPDLSGEAAIVFHRRPTTDDPAQPAAAEPAQSPERDDQPATTADSSTPWVNPDSTLFAAAADAGPQSDTATESTANPTADDDDTPPPVSASGRAASVVRKIAEMEARAPRPPLWEPDSRSAAPFAGVGPDAIEWRDEPLTTNKRRPQPETTSQDAVAETVVDDTNSGDSPQIDAAATFDLDDDLDQLSQDAVTDAALETLAGRDEAEASEAYLDEDALRELVASIVREELQGALGERITRNVRKLVRREIHRALAAHDLL
jgi:hypothetical protein